MTCRQLGFTSADFDRLTLTELYLRLCVAAQDCK